MMARAGVRGIILCVARSSLLLGAVLCVGAPAAAQSQTQTQDPAAEAREEVETLGSGQRRLGGPGGALLNRDCPPVVYADILAAPDDPGLNACYAVQQIGDGDLTGAAATLERVLLLRPRQADIRLLYAIVLYRLDTLEEAQAEFRAVQQLDLPPEDEARIARYLERIEKQLQRTVQTLTVSIGGHYDTNRNAAPGGEEVDVLGTTLPLASDSRAEDDTAVIASARYDVRHDLGLQREHYAVGSVTYYQDEQTERDELDLQAVFLDGGFAFDLPGSVTVTPKAEYATMRLSREKFYSSYGGSVRVQKSIRRAARKAPIDLWLEVGRTRERFHNISENRSLTGRDGLRTDGEVGLGLWLTPRHRLTVTGGQSYKDARRGYQSYRFWRGRLRHTWYMTDGAFLDSTASYGVRLYHAADPLITPGNTSKRRREHPLRLRMTYGLPATVLLEKLGYSVRDETTGAVDDILDDLTASASAEYLSQQSNIRNYDYDNLRGQVLLTKRFEF
ncbi:tetratricopeptide repeat protein [Marivibrio halodurans]|uniref:Tetratricopeptide repeat protein n=1 Tax=Marivibrio halodurans TaxID=2039722 RepID=A0A8J7SMV1_9PROT|nr:tetratricopeptide repeat protein [Marivibrio halodurans]MBP5857211.1 tetratricopeptide repeat protein [Marivibrio halodurans]